LVVAFSYGLRNRLPVEDRRLRQLLSEAPRRSWRRLQSSARLLAGLLQAEFLFAFDLYDLGVVHSDFHRAETQIAQRALDFTQDRAFVLTVNAAKGCAHGAAPLKGICLAVGGTAFGVGAI
jgi:hypothetical protein